MKLDRNLHRRILEAAYEAYPNETFLADAGGEETLNYYANLLYLEEHGLIDSGLLKTPGGAIPRSGFKAKYRGVDFIADDGGLSAILGVVTIRFHEDTIKQLLIDRVEASKEPTSVKSSLIKQLKDLPAEGLKTLTTKALEAAMTDLPNAMHQLGTWLGHL